MYDIVRRGYIEVFRVESAQRTFVSRHIDEAEAVGAANNHGEARGGGRYLLVYPNKEVDVRIVIQGPAPTVPVIGALPVTGSGTELDIELTTPSTGPAPPYTYSLEEAAVPTGPFAQFAAGAVFTGSPPRYRRTVGVESTTRFYRAVAYDSASPQRASAPSSVASGTTHDVTAAALSFTNITGAAQSTLIESNDSPVSGITTSVPISVTGGAYRINGGAWVTVPGTVSNGATVRVRTTSASSPDTAVTLTLTIGGVATNWSVRTAATVGIAWPVHNPAYSQGPPAIPGHAFPGADSYGGAGRNLAASPGTPRTTIIFIDNLGSGAAVGTAEPAWGPNVFRGNWRFAWQHTATPKVIMPLIGGWLTFGDNSNSTIGLDNWSFWGQFAPQPGFFLRAMTPVINGGNNVQIWHLRSYVGDDPDGGSYNADSRDGLTWAGAGGSTTDATQRNLLINGEFFWTVDETIEAFFAFAQLTCLYNVFAEPLHAPPNLPHAGDPVGTDHGFGPLMGGASAQPDFLVMMRNAFSGVTDRAPLTNARRMAHANNINYNHLQHAVHVHATNSQAMLWNVLGNLFLRGPDNGSSTLIGVDSQFASAPAASRVAVAFNSQHGWSNPASQLSFVRNEPFAGWGTTTLQTTALPTFWGDTALTGLLKWALNPLAPTTAELNAFINLMAANCGTQPGMRTSGIGRVATVFNQMRDRIAGVANPPEYHNTVAEYGGWFNVPTVGPINPLAPGAHWHAPLPTTADRDDTQGPTALNNGLIVTGYTKLELWALNQHIFVGGFVPTPTPSAAQPLLFDDFNYLVARDEPSSTAQPKFQAKGWASVKRLPEAGAGHIFIVDRPTGYLGALPNPAGRCLIMEAHPIDIGGGFVQTDFYLQYGLETDPRVYGHIPPRFWLQFWVYPIAVSGEMSNHAARSKYIYGNAPAAPLGTEGFGDVVNGVNAFQGVVGHDLNGNPVWTTPNENFFIGNRPGYGAFGGNTGANRGDQAPENRDKLGINLLNKPVLANRWNLVRMLFDTSGPQGQWHMWQRDQSESVLVKPAEWIGGVTSLFNWLTSANDRLGNSKFRWPTIVNNNPYWHAYQDFVIAETELALPTSASYGVF